MAKIDVEHPPKDAEIKLYISPDCPYCARAIAYYDHEGIKYTTCDAQNNEALRDEMFRYTSDDPTVPAIVVNGEYVQSGWGSPPRG